MNMDVAKCPHVNNDL